MTPKVRANEFYNVMLWSMPHPATTNANVHIISKKCALKAVEQILVSIVHKDQDERLVYELLGNKFYWEDVIKEIEKL